MKLLNLRVIGLVILISATLSSFAQNTGVKRVEPPFWWTGMHNPDLQLLVYGDAVATTVPEIRYKGVKIVRTATLSNPNYLFIDLKIDKKAKPGTFTINFLKDKEVKASWDYQLMARADGSAERKGFDQSDAIYLIFPDRFVNGDPDNDAVEGMLEKADRSLPDGRHGGDIAGVAQHLDYIKELGFTAVWLNPVLENNMPAYSYHGYAITDFYKVDPRMGSNEEYKALADEMHQKGLKLIMDMIFNHCGSNHWWIKDLPSEDWIHQFPEFTKTNYRGSTIFDPYASEYDKKIFQQGWFDTHMPDLNQHNPYLMTYLIQNSIWWIEYAGLDGIRMDTYPYPYEDSMAEWARRVLEEYPGFSMVGEAWLNYPSQVAVWQADEHVYDSYQSHLPYVFDFPLYDALGRAFTEGDGWSTGVIRFYDVLSQDYLYTHPENIVVFADNHDGSRIFTKVGESLNRLRMAITLVMTTRGVPQIYYGTEILMAGDEGQGHGKLRKDFPGGWQGDTVNAFTGNGLTFDQKKALNFMTRLANWRKNKPVMHHGKLKHFLPVDGLYVYFRYDDNDTVMVVLNSAEKPNYFDRERYSEMLEGFRYGKNILTNKMYELSKMKIFPETPMVLELKK